jgi:hypothetical protein
LGGSKFFGGLFLERGALSLEIGDIFRCRRLRLALWMSM